MADPLFSTEEEAAMRADAQGLPSERRDPVSNEADAAVDRALDGRPPADAATGEGGADADVNADARPEANADARLEARAHSQPETGSDAQMEARADTAGQGPQGTVSDEISSPEARAPTTAEATPETERGKRIAALVEAIRTGHDDDAGDDIVPFQEEGPSGAPVRSPGEDGAEVDATAVEELDIEDAEEVVHEVERPALVQPPMTGAPPDWFERVFDEDYLRILPPVDERQMDKEIRFLADHLSVPKGARLLDLGCGHGLLATMLQGLGYDMVGLDSSMTMLTVATEEARRRGLGPSFVHGDMRALALDSEFDAVLCIHGTLGYFDEEENARILGNVFRALRPGGKFVLSVPNRDYFVADLPARICWESHGSMVLDEVDFDFLLSRLEVRRSIAFEDGRQVEHRYSVRVYAMHEIVRLLGSSGFGVTTVSGSVATPGTFLGPYSRSIWVFAQKP